MDCPRFWYREVKEGRMPGNMDLGLFWFIFSKVRDSYRKVRKN